MKFTEEQATELMQYAIDERRRYYENLKSEIKYDLTVYNTNFRNIHESMCVYREGIVIGVYSLLMRYKIISPSDFKEMCKEVHNKFDVDSIYVEIKNQESLNV